MFETNETTNAIQKWYRQEMLGFISWIIPIISLSDKRVGQGTD